MTNNVNMSTKTSRYEDKETDPNSIACSYYINACFSVPDPPKDSAPGLCMLGSIPPCAPLKPTRILPADALRDAIKALGLAGRWWLDTTPGGLVVAFSRKKEAELLLEKVDMARVLDGPVQVAFLPPRDLSLHHYFHHQKLEKNTEGSSGCPACNIFVIRDVPWSVPLEDIRAALDAQGVTNAVLDHWRQHVRIELKNPLYCQHLLSRGVDFFGVSRFTVCMERAAASVSWGLGQADVDVLQCYRCQGFWHVAGNCRLMPRCVRCGEPHGVEFCMRPRNNPLCCNCSGAHHAAYKFCPVRRQIGRSAPVFFTLSKYRPVGSSAPISPNTNSDKPRCLL